MISWHGWFEDPMKWTFDHPRKHLKEVNGHAFLPPSYQIKIPLSPWLIAHWFTLLIDSLLSCLNNDTLHSGHDDNPLVGFKGRFCDKKLKVVFMANASTIVHGGCQTPKQSKSVCSGFKRNLICTNTPNIELPLCSLLKKNPSCPSSLVYTSTSKL